jgi:SAM-dependent methyltransferase
VVVCSECGFAFADGIPPASIFDHYYECLSRAEYAYSGGGDSQFDKIRFAQIADYLSKHFIDKNLRIIDLGCAGGGLLAQLKERHYANICGLDPSRGCAKNVQTLYDIHVSVGTLINNKLCQGNFDLAILVGVLEHVHDLSKALQSLTTLVSDNGYLFIDVPDATAFQNWPDAPFQEFSIEHINFFGPQSLTNLVCQFDFEQVEIKQLPRQVSKTTVMPCVTGLFRKLTQVSYKLVIDRLSEPALRQYIALSEREERRIAEILEELANREQKIVAWGAGTHTLHLLKTTALNRCKIIAYLDSNPKVQGQTLQGLPILKPSSLKEYAEPVLISSRVFQDDIARQIREDLKAPNELIFLYPNATY